MIYQSRNLDPSKCGKMDTIMCKLISEESLVWNLGKSFTQVKGNEV